MAAKEEYIFVVENGSKVDTGTTRNSGKTSPFPLSLSCQRCEISLIVTSGSAGISVVTARLRSVFQQMRLDILDFQKLFLFRLSRIFSI